MTRDWAHAVTLADQMPGVVISSAEVHAPQPAGVLRWVLGCTGAEPVYVLIHVRSGFLIAVPHAWGSVNERIERQLTASTRISPEAASRIQETAVFDRQAVLLPEPMRQRIELALDTVDQSPDVNEALAGIEALNDLRVHPAYGRTPRQAWTATLERLAESPRLQRSWWEQLRRWLTGPEISEQRER